MMHGEGGFFYMQGGGLLVWLLLAALVVIPFWKILPRAGLSSWWALVALFPLFQLVLLWVLAFKTWPGDRKEAM
jgi:hypothetical protein